MSSTSNVDTTKTCTCADDPDVDELRALIARGYDQFEASRILWGSPAPVSTALAVHVAGRQARRLVRTTLAAAFPWLRLPTPTGPEVP